MKSDRRTFIRQTSLAAAGVAIFPQVGGAAVFPGSPQTRVTLQLYTVRDEMKADPRGTLAKVAAMGYRYVEHANYTRDRSFYGIDEGRFRRLLIDQGLSMTSGHTELKEGVHWDAGRQQFTEDWMYTLRDARDVGQEYVICPWLDESLRGDYDRLRRWLEVFNKCGELCKSMGLKFGYHNHDFEFKDHLNGRLLYDIILSETDPSLVAQQLDIGNLILGGAKPQDVLAAHPGRFTLLHVKDMIPAHGTGEMGGAYESTILGQGMLGTRDILRTAVAQGATQLTIEQESYQGRAPLDDTRKDLEVMRHWGYKG